MRAGDYCGIYRDDRVALLFDHNMGRQSFLGLCLSDTTLAHVVAGGLLLLGRLFTGSFHGLTLTKVEPWMRHLPTYRPKGLGSTEWLLLEIEQMHLTPKQCRQVRDACINPQIPPR